ncbi:unnamed protein product, partial [marine sediment metagenome]
GLKHKWGQIVYVTGHEYKILLRLFGNHRDLPRLLLYEGIKYIINNGGSFHIHQDRGMKIYDIDSQKDLLKAQELL